MRSALTLASLLFPITISSAFAGAWTLPEGKSYLSLKSYYYTSSGFYNASAKRQSQPTFSKHELNPYYEYGWNDELTLGASFFLQRLKQEGSSSDMTNWGIGDPEMFARYELKRTDEYALSIEPLIKPPSYYARDALPKAGSEDWEAELALLAGYHFEWFDHTHYADSRIAYRHRFATLLNDQISADVKVGFNLGQDWQLVPALYATLSTDLPGKPVFTESGQNDYDLLKLECNLLYKLRPELYVQAGVFSHLIGRNAGDGHGFLIGTEYHF